MNMRTVACSLLLAFIAQSTTALAQDTDLDAVVLKLQQEVAQLRGLPFKAPVSSQAAAYYDPRTKKFYTLIENAAPMMMQMLYSHELYHGLQAEPPMSRLRARRSSKVRRPTS